MLNLRQILEEYVKFQMDVITRRTRFDLKKAQERAHILEGLMIALDFIDEVIAILRAAKSIPEGKTALMERFGLDDVQAQAIVQMRLGQLTGLEREKSRKSWQAWKEKIADFLDILASEGRRLAIVKDEAQAMKKKFGDERRTEIAAISGEVDIEDLIPVEECVLTLTNFGYVKRQKMDTYRLQRRGGRGVTGMTRRDEDVATELCHRKPRLYPVFLQSGPCLPAEVLRDSRGFPYQPWNEHQESSPPSAGGEGDLHDPGNPV